MKEQLIRLMESENMSPAKFADEIGVQRSSISHILSDRNKPSYDFIQKVLSKFPGISVEWLLTGKGTMIKNVSITPKEIKQASLFEENTTRSQNNATETNKNNEKISVDYNLFAQHVTQNQQNSIIETSSKSINSSELTNVNDIQFVMIYYKDGTFKRYTSR